MIKKNNLNELNELVEKLKLDKNLSEDQKIELLVKSGIIDQDIASNSEEERLEILKSILPDLKELEKKLTMVQEAVVKPSNKHAKAVNEFHDYLKRNNLKPDENSRMKELFRKYCLEEMDKSGEGCFHFDQDKCDFVIDAHSLQKGGPLKEISENHQVYGLNRKEIKSRFVLTPIKKASTFRGFCHEHDSLFQQTIEQTPFEESNSYHAFLHAYRSFAYSYQKKFADQKFTIDLYDKSTRGLNDFLGGLKDIMRTIGMENLSKKSSIDLKPISEDQKKIFEIERYEKYRNELNYFLKNEEYERIEHIIASVPHKIPFACSSWLKSELIIQGVRILVISDDPYHGYPLMVTALPGRPSYIILSRFTKDLPSETMFNNLNAIKNRNHDDFLRIISSLILRYVENLYFSPNFWNSQDSYLKERFISEAMNNDPDFMELSVESDMVNLFDQIYSVK